MKAFRAASTRGEAGEECSDCISDSVVVDGDDGKFVSCSFGAISLDAHEQGDGLIDRRLHVGCVRRYGAHSNAWNSACEPLNFPT